MKNRTFSWQDALAFGERAQRERIVVDFRIDKVAVRKGGNTTAGWNGRIVSHPELASIPVFMPVRAICDSRHIADHHVGRTIKALVIEAKHDSARGVNVVVSQAALSAHIVHTANNGDVHTMIVSQVQEGLGEVDLINPTTGVVAGLPIYALRERGIVVDEGIEVNVRVIGKRLPGGRVLIPYLLVELTPAE